MKQPNQTRRQLVRRYKNLRYEIDMVEAFDLPCTNLQEMKDELVQVGEAIANKQYLTNVTLQVCQ